VAPVRSGCDVRLESAGRKAQLPPDADGEGQRGRVAVQPAFAQAEPPGRDVDREQFVGIPSTAGDQCPSEQGCLERHQLREERARLLGRQLIDALGMRRQVGQRRQRPDHGAHRSGPDRPT
jgi:hypothetical protein